MSSTFRKILVCLIAIFALGAVASASASASTPNCYKVAPGETGHWEKSTCLAPVGTTKEYVMTEGAPTADLGSGVLCIKVKAGEPSAWSNNTCTTAHAGTGEFAKVLENEEEQQRFSPGFVGFACTEVAAEGQREYATDAACEELEGKETVGGKWRRHTTRFVSKEGASTLTVTGVTVTCQKDTDKGELWGKESVANVVVTFMECKGKKGTEECKVKSKGAAGAEEIVTNTLKGELGEVAKAEATTEVGLLLEGESSNVFVTLEGGCLPAGGGAVEGSVVGEVTPLALAFNDTVVFTLNGGGEQKVKTFERSLALHCGNAPAARKCSADFSFKPKLEAFTKAATFVSTDENEFVQRAEEVLPGV
jgi:hypothetical protein